MDYETFLTKVRLALEEYISDDFTAETQEKAQLWVHRLIHYTSIEDPDFTLDDLARLMANDLME